MGIRICIDWCKEGTGSKGKILDFSAYSLLRLNSIANGVQLNRESRSIRSFLLARPITISTITHRTHTQINVYMQVRVHYFAPSLQLILVHLKILSSGKFRRYSESMKCNRGLETFIPSNIVLPHEDEPPLKSNRPKLILFPSDPSKLSWEIACSLPNILLWILEWISSNQRVKTFFTSNNNVLRKRTVFQKERLKIAS